MHRGTIEPTTLRPGWKGGWNAGRSMYLSDVGRISLAAGET